jgi:hypothetical protein
MAIFVQKSSGTEALAGKPTEELEMTIDCARQRGGAASQQQQENYDAVT